MTGIGETPEGTTPVPAVVQQIDFRSTLHPFENSRLVLALSASSVVLVGGLALTIYTIGLFNAVFAVGLPLVAVFGSLWVALQLQRARLLGNAIRVESDSLPDVHAALATVRQQLAYDRRVDVYVAAEVTGKATWLSFLGHRVILLEGDFVTNLLTTGGQAALRFIIGSFMGALKARHSRLLPIFLILQVFDSVKFLALFLMPYLRATRYSGDQLGWLCSGDLKVAINAVGRLLVGQEVAPDLGVRAVLDQAAMAQTRFLPRLAQFFTQTPHLVNRYMNILAFSARVAPRDFRAFAENLSEDTRQRLDLLLAATSHMEQRSPDVEQRPSAVEQGPPDVSARRIDRRGHAAGAVVAVVILALGLIWLGSNWTKEPPSISPSPTAPSTVVPTSLYTAKYLFDLTENGDCDTSPSGIIGHNIEAIYCSGPVYGRYFYYFYKYRGVDADSWVDEIRAGGIFTNLTLVDDSSSCHKIYAATYTSNGVRYNTVLFVYRNTPFVAGVNGDARLVDTATLVKAKFYVRNRNALC